ncbi:MAG: hypothetical protein OEX02_00405 [Cyclobacteriaceae bacterium]|nr:hypothetical protein [Cyclobacteriaceae bacterium]
MTKTFTQNDIIRYLYNEMGTDESIAFFRSLETDAELRQDYQENKRVFQCLDTTEIAAPSRVLNKILNFSRNYNQKTNTKVGG